MLVILDEFVPVAVIQVHLLRECRVFVSACDAVYHLISMQDGASLIIKYATTQERGVMPSEPKMFRV